MSCDVFCYADNATLSKGIMEYLKRSTLQMPGQTLVIVYTGVPPCNIYQEAEKLNPTLRTIQPSRSESDRGYLAKSHTSLELPKTTAAQ